MRVQGYGELENVHKSVRKDGAKKPQPPPAEAGAQKPGEADAVAISPQARLLAKIRQLPEVRQEEVRKALAKLEDGTLTSPEAVEQGIQDMLREIL
jgi:hypothetical protein